jgi:hypothetical protein
MLLMSQQQQASSNPTLREAGVSASRVAGALQCQGWRDGFGVWGGWDVGQ